MEGTTTLADALLDDLDDLMDSDEEAEEEAKPSEVPSETTAVTDTASSSGGMGVSTWDIIKPAPTISSSNDKTENVPKLSRAFLEGKSLQKHLSKIRARGTSSRINDTKEQQEEDHFLVVQSNRHLASVAEEITTAHGALAKAYHPKFPELEELLPNYVQYKNAVCCIGNEMDLTRVNDSLNKILNSNQIITISVAGSTTSGRPLTEAEMEQVEDAASYMEALLEIQTELVTFVEKSMEGLAPSICALVGPSTAAKLLGLAGGLAEITKIPACNLQVMGQVKQNSASRAGLSSANVKQHAGVLADCDLVRSVPKHLQQKTLKAVAAKLALAARFDFVNVDAGRPRSAVTGLKLRKQLEDKFEKLQEPDKAPVLKALPNANKMHMGHSKCHLHYSVLDGNMPFVDSSPAQGSVLCFLLPLLDKLSRDTLIGKLHLFDHLHKTNHVFPLFSYSF